MFFPSRVNVLEQRKLIVHWKGYFKEDKDGEAQEKEANYNDPYFSQVLFLNLFIDSPQHLTPPPQPAFLVFYPYLLSPTLLPLLLPVFNSLLSLLLSLQLIASNVEGKSSPSEVLVCTTNPDKPGPPSTPRVTGVTPYGFTVTWGNI